MRGRLSLAASECFFFFPFECALLQTALSFVPFRRLTCLRFSFVPPLKIYLQAQWVGFLLQHMGKRINVLFAHQSVGYCAVVVGLNSLPLGVSLLIVFHTGLSNLPQLYMARETT